LARIKDEEKSARRAIGGGKGANDTSLAGFLEGIPLSLPGLTRAVKLQAKASRVGFDWNDIRAVIAKIREETSEIEAALEAGEQKGIEEEIGDLLFTVANLARHAQADPESTIRGANAKFERRFFFVQQELARKGIALGSATLNEMDVLWDVAKADEKL
jgi:ATP diphosphatase